MVKLTIPDCPGWAKPALFLTQRGEDKKDITLTLSIDAPSKGYNDEFYGALLKVHSSIKNTHHLWFVSEDSIEGLSCVFSFEEGDEVISALRIEVIAKIHKLFYSGDYIVKRFHLEEAMA